MRVAVPIWKERLSPVFDTATRVVVFEVDGDEPRKRGEYTPMRPGLDPCLCFLQKAEVQWLLCGAISQGWRRRLEAGGIHVIPFLAGSWRTVLAAFKGQRLNGSDYHMPGCRGRRCRRHARGPGRRKETK